RPGDTHSPPTSTNGVASLRRRRTRGTASSLAEGGRSGRAGGGDPRQQLVERGDVVLVARLPLLEEAGAFATVLEQPEAEGGADADVHRLRRVAHDAAEVVGGRGRAEGTERARGGDPHLRVLVFE